MKERMSDNQTELGAGSVSLRDRVKSIFSKKVETPEQRKHDEKVMMSRRKFLKKAIPSAVLAGVVMTTPDIVAKAAGMLTGDTKGITDPMPPQDKGDGFPPKGGSKVSGNENTDRHEQESKILKLDAVEVADLNPGGTPIFMRKPAEALDTQLFASVKDSIDHAVNVTTTFVDNSTDEGIKKISNVTAVIVGKKDNNQSTPEPQVTPTAPDNNQEFVDVFITAVGKGLYVKGDKVWYYDNGDVLDAMGVKDANDPRISKDFYIFPTTESKLIAANLKTGETYASGELGENGKVEWKKVDVVANPDTAKIWESSIIPSAEKLGESTGAGITFYLDETFKTGKVPQEMVPHKIEIKSEDRFKTYGEYMIYLNLKNAGSDLASGDFDSYLKKVSDKQKNGEKPTWQLMAIDTKTLKPTTVDVPISEISYTGKLANNTLKISEIKGGAQFDILFADPSFYKLHPLSYVNASGELFEKAGIFVNPDNPTKIMMVDVMVPSKNGDIGIWYAGKPNNGDLANQVQKLFGLMTLKQDINADILNGKVGNLDAGGGKVKLYTGIYEYPFWRLLFGTAPKDFKNINFTLSIS